MNATIKKMKKQGLTFWGEFKAFAIRGNVVDLAIGVVIGSTFTTITNSLVKDIIMPPLGLVTSGINFSNLFIDLSGKDFATLAQAQAAGVPTINYGMFLNAILNFFVVALVVFIVIKQINRLERREEAGPAEPTQKTCPFCSLSIPRSASRCPHCTSRL